jgi:transcriptional regulator with XRE-family HTH domain
MPPPDKSRALDMLFRGYSARRVAEELGVSNVTVSKILRDFISEAEGANSVLAAAEKYGIEEQVKQLIGIGEVVEETKVEPSRAGLGLRIVKAAMDLDVDPEGVPGFIEAVNKEAAGQHLSTEAFVKTVKGLYGWGIGGISDYQRLLKEVKAKHNELENLDNQVITYEGKASAAKEQMDEAVKSKNTTLEELDKYTALRGRLSPLGLDLRDLDKVESCLTNIAEQGNDPVAVAAFYSQGVGLSKKVKDMEARVSYLSKAELVAGNKLNETNKALESKTELAARVREAEALDLRPSQLGVLVETTREVGARHGKGMKESITRLEVDLRENWEPKLGFENDKTKLAAELGQLDERVKLAEERERVTLEKIRAHEESLKELEQLKIHVSASELVEFKRVIVDSGHDVPTFRGEVERLRSVTAAVDSVKQRKEAEVAKLETREKTLGAQVEQLNKTKTELEAKISTLHSNAIEAIIRASNMMMDVANGLKEDFEHPETGYKAEIQRIKNEAVFDAREQLKAEREDLKKSFGELRGFLTRSASEVEKIKQGTWEVGKLVGFSTHLTCLANLVAGEQVVKADALPTMKMTVDAFVVYLRKNNMDNLCPSLKKFNDELERNWL